MTIKRIILMAFLIQLSLTLDYQRQYENQRLFQTIITAVQQNKLIDLRDTLHKKCTDGTCCICNKQFKNSTFSTIHMAIHHSQHIKLSSKIDALFDGSIPNLQKSSLCMNFLKQRNLSIQEKEKVCIIVSEDYYKPNLWIQIIRYILYFTFGLLSMVYYGDIFNRMK